MDPRIKLIRPCAWEEIFLSWYESEANNPQWVELAKERGYASWADWRINGYARRFECEKAKWGLYEIEDPSAVVAGWYGGPFRTWIERYYNGEKAKSFAELAALPEVINNDRVIGMSEDYPKESIISALRLKSGKIFVVEGMHRACTLAHLGLLGKPYPNKLIFAVGESELEELPPAGKNTTA
jgi:hypothetical protein